MYSHPVERIIRGASYQGSHAMPGVAKQKASPAPRGTEGGPIALGGATAPGEGATGSPTEARTAELDKVLCTAREI